MRVSVFTRWLLLPVAALAGCHLKNALEDEPDGGAAAAAPCAGEPNGTSCGARRQCLEERCVAERCGDGIRSSGEACDDGNRVDRGDGCSNDCSKSAVCGNGVVEDPETCDDGNREDGDPCPSSCVKAVCGNGIVEAESGEVCDGPSVDQGEVRSCNSDCRAWVEVEEDRCRTCQIEHCTRYNGSPAEEEAGVGDDAGVDDEAGVSADAGAGDEAGGEGSDTLNVVDGCLTQIDSRFGADPDDSRFLQECADVVNCALAHQCGLGGTTDAERLPSACYCGRSTDECTTLGPAEDAPCRDEWLAAGRAKNNDEMQLRFTDTQYPAAWAYFLLGCIGDRCATECAAGATGE